MSATPSTTADPALLPAPYLRWVAAATASRAGDAAMYLALGWAASAQGAAATGLVITAVVAPRTLLMLLGGAVGDRVGARAVMVTGDAVLLVASTALLLAVLSVGAPLWLLLVAALVEGIVTAFYQPASSAMPRHLVDDDVLPRALALRQGAGQLADLLGAPLGGLLVGLAGLAAVAGANALTYAIVLVVLLGVRPSRDVGPPSSGSLLRQAGDGVATAMRSSLVRTTVLLTGATAGLVLPAGMVLLPVLIRARDWDPVVGGVVLGAQAAGALVVTAAVTRWGASRWPGRTAVRGTAAAAAALAVLGLAPTPAAAVAAGVALGAGIALFTTHIGPLVLIGAPRTHLARVQALLGVAQAGALLISTPLLGFAASGTTPTTALLTCAGLLLLTSLLAATSRDLRRVERAPFRAG